MRLTMPLPRFLMLLATLAVVLTTLGGCGTFTSSDDPIRFQIDEPLGLDIQSFGGDVVVEVDEQRTDVKLIVTREGRHGFGRHKAAGRDVESIDYRTEVINTERGKVMRITTSSDAQQPELLRANLRILAPAIDGVKVRTTGGDVRLEMIRGALDVQTDGGRIMVQTAWAMTEPITIINNGGPIDYRVRGESSGMFDCETIGGRVSASVLFGQLVVDASTDADTFRGILNEGSNPVAMRALDGDIRIAVLADPLALGGAIWP